MDLASLDRAMATLAVATEGLTAMSLQVRAERDFARGGVHLYLRVVGRASLRVGAATVGEQILWRAATPIFMGEGDARDLAEQLGEFHPTVSRANQYREQRDRSQNEMRSLSNQLETVLAHNTTLVRMNEAALRQIWWLERELRDTNQERRAAE